MAGGLDVLGGLEEVVEADKPRMSLATEASTSGTEVASNAVLASVSRYPAKLILRACLSWPIVALIGMKKLSSIAAPGLRPAA